MKICPYCEQEYVRKVSLKSAPYIRFSMCMECDSVWTDNENISSDSGSVFEKYMKEIGQNVDWNNIFIHSVVD